MNELANGAAGLASTGFMLALVILGLIVWFFVNRASVKASQHIRLLESLLEEQKRQTLLLRRLNDALAGNEKGDPASDSQNKEFIRLIPER
ncbi:MULTISPECIES: YebO family protein [unclassified Erwinia]|uniref:YebO family protein n=1 Tax=unclassified Erwinia TaxID=2622719 RepID=UPI00082DEC42|nr:YebO family protein [Erwinia sp. ErVv1]